MSVKKIWLATQKPYLHRPIKILHFLTSARIKKCLKTNQLQPQLRVAHITTNFFLHVIPVRIIVR